MVLRKFFRMFLGTQSTVNVEEFLLSGMGVRDLDSIALQKKWWQNF